MGIYQKMNYYCMIFEFAFANLGEFIHGTRKRDNFKKSKENLLQILYETSKGLSCLHRKDIVHCDIKPLNILLVSRGNKIVACLCDFGKSSKDPQQTYTTETVGTELYAAKELTRERNKRIHGNSKEAPRFDYKKCDIYSLGRVFDHTLTFDTNHERRQNLKEFQGFGNVDITAALLILHMTDLDPNKRVNVEGVLRNPIFWNAERKIEFLRVANGYAQSPIRDNKRIDEINEKAKKIFKNNSKNEGLKQTWPRCIEDVKCRKEIDIYLREVKLNEKSVFDLVKLILYLVSLSSMNNSPRDLQQT